MALLALVVAGGCAPGEPVAERPAASPAPSPAEPMADLVPKGAEAVPGIITAGQPSYEQLELLEARGLRSVINLRVPTERGTSLEPDWAARLNLDYRAVPIDGAGGLTEAAARELDLALAEAERPVLLHCGSSNRVGALLALRAFYVEGRSVEESMEVGLEAGLTRLEAATRKILERAAAS